ncbi:MAG: MFS transporter [Rubritalea sp.]|uniref:MFS transporter n=1 Tax=Rubritalea sp. TaxID=2109375 RepID=UPI0032422C7F
MQNPREREDHHIASKRDERSFWTMVGLAAQNAFNDKAAQFFLIPLAAWLVVQSGAGDGGNMKYILGGLIVAPFIFLSPFAGWLSDRYSKTWVLRSGMVLQLLVLVMITFSILLQNLSIGIFGFFLLAVQSTLLSPAKKGLVKEMVGSERLGFASGVLEMASVLAICVGQIVSGFWFDSRLAVSQDGWEAALTPIMIITVMAIPAVLFSWTLKYYPSPSSRPFQLKILWEHVGQLGDLFNDRRLKWAGLGVAFFWFFGGFINLAAVQLAEVATGGGQGFGSEMAWFLAAASGGIVLGGVLGSMSCRRNIELGLVPIGCLLTTLGCVLMAMCSLESFWLKVWMVFTGAGAALFLVPLNAHFQDVCDPSKRGRVLAGLNLLDCLAGAGAVAFQLLLSKLGVSMGGQFLSMAVLCLIVAGYSTKLLPQHFIRFTMLSVFRIFYRQKVLYAERMPESGGVLLVPNHVTYIDAFILTAASPRPIRFLMHDSYFDKEGILRHFVKLFDTVPISEHKAKEAITIAAEAVKEGAVVCIFPEGQLTRSAAMTELKRGFEMIARKAKCPVMPVYMDGLWGSIFSFERGRLFKKIPYSVPYGVTVAWGEPELPRMASAVAMRKALHQLSSESMEMRGVLLHPSRLLNKKLELLDGDKHTFSAMLDSVKKMDEGEQRALITNALQVAESPAFSKRGVIVVDSKDEVALIFAIGLPLVHQVRVLLADEYTSVSHLEEWNLTFLVEAYIGGESLRLKVAKLHPNDAVFYHTGGYLDQEAEVPCYPVGVLSGKVIAISTKHPNAISTTNQFQAGWKEGSIGRLLPGFTYNDGDPGFLKFSGLVFGVDGDNQIVTRARMDAEGFLYL